MLYALKARTAIATIGLVFLLNIGNTANNLYEIAPYAMGPLAGSPVKATMKIARKEFTSAFASELRSEINEVRKDEIGPS